MRLKLFSPVKQITISRQYPAAIASDRFGYIHHFRIEFSDPLHFVVVIDRCSDLLYAISDRKILYYFTTLHNYITIGSSPLEIRDDAEYEPGEFPVLLCGF